MTPPTNCRPRCFKTGQTFRDKNLFSLVHMKIHIKLPFSSALALLMQCPGTFINERSYRRFAAPPRQYDAYIGTAFGSHIYFKTASLGGTLSRRWHFTII